MWVGAQISLWHPHVMMWISLFLTTFVFFVKSSSKSRTGWVRKTRNVDPLRVYLKISPFHFSSTNVFSHLLLHIIQFQKNSMALKMSIFCWSVSCKVALFLNCYLCGRIDNTFMPIQDKLDKTYVVSLWNREDFVLWSLNGASYVCTQAVAQPPCLAWGNIWVISLSFLVASAT